MKTYPCRSLIFLYYLLLLVAVPCVYAGESAWNGHTPPGSSALGPLRSEYVPPGAKGYPSTSPLISYKGDWKTLYSSNFYNNAARYTSQEHASMTFSFTGTGIEWFGNCGEEYGIAQVYIDKTHVASVNTYCDSNLPQPGQRHFGEYRLPSGKHTLTIIAVGTCDATSFVVTRAKGSSSHSQKKPRFSENQWTLTQEGSTGVNAMQIAVLDEAHAIIFDKVEHNPLTINSHPSWASLFNLKTRKVIPLDMQSNSFCAGGSFLSNGTLINVGGNPVVTDHTSPSDFGDVDGLQSIRLVHPCSDGHYSVAESHDTVRMASPRWYSTSIRLDDGSVAIIGGSKKGGWINNATVNNPTIEYFPPKDIQGSNGLPILLPFLKDTLNSNLFPIVCSLPDGRLFIAANNDAMIYDWKNNVEQRLPPIPNGVRVTYPMAGTGLLLPLSSANGYAPEILLCGGSDVDDTKAGYEISSQDPASSQCSRMVLTDEGISAGWEVDQMPRARLMPDAVLLPDGKIVFVNGAGSGISGYGNVVDQVGVSNADKPVLIPDLYDPSLALGSRFSSEALPSSAIPRMYHSVAIQTPAGDIMIAGSNPNLDRSEVAYGTEYRVEWLSPPYMRGPRPQILRHNAVLGFGEEATMTVKLVKPNSNDVRVVLMDHGFVTHAVHSNSRMVYLDCLNISGDTITIKGPPDGGVYPPGPGFLYIVEDGVPCEGVRIMVGDGKGPQVNQAALENMLKSTQPDQYEKSKTSQDNDNDGE
ncbi:copper radical oxidase [Rhodocollybia butyracea]|uniref:Copper radical oxidase n=1 Tax=Rhodocollybia butyracea TaxID=206335 RepID=A0A9P5UFC4_9AGAR|nr:copper radical oxidase [Rhodocollybia butyracea]